MEREMDEISLREIIEVVWNGKWVIILITAIAVAASGIISFFVLDPVNEARSTVMVNNQATAEEPPQLTLQAYMEQVENHAIMRKTIIDLNLSEYGITINTLREKIDTEIIKDTNLIRIKATDKDPKLAADITNTVTSEFVTFMSNQSKEQLKREYNYEIERIDEEIVLNQANLNKIKEELANTPEILVTNKSLSEEAYLHSVVSDRDNGSNAETGSIQLRDEQLNPLYISLQQSESNTNLEISKLQNKKVEIEQKILENRLIVKEDLSVVSPAIEPEEPVGPRKLLNVAIAGVVGGMISLFIVFLMAYWRNSSNDSSVYTRMNDNSTNISG
jgi:succinoglycan biosynthesis transport protein ExoP